VDPLVPMLADRQAAQVHEVGAPRQRVADHDCGRCRHQDRAVDGERGHLEGPLDGGAAVAVVRGFHLTRAQGDAQRPAVGPGDPGSGQRLGQADGSRGCVRSDVERRQRDGAGVRQVDRPLEDGPARVHHGFVQLVPTAVVGRVSRSDRKVDQQDRHHLGHASSDCTTPVGGCAKWRHDRTTGR
jgi:hypothetical protein